MSLPFQILFFLFLGSIIGLLSGLLGIGGGTITIPCMIFLLPLFDIPKEFAMQTAIGTSLAAVIFSTASSAWSHHRAKRIRWRLVKKVALSFVVGALTGSLLAQDVPSAVLQKIFGTFEVGLGIYFLFMKIHSTSSPHPLPNPLAMNIMGYLISTISVFLGIGGGFITVPALAYCKLSIKEAIGTSTILSFLLATAGTILFLIPERSIPLHAYAWGYIYLPAFIPLAVASLFLAQVGASLIHKVPSELLRKAFSFFIIIAGLGMLL